MHGHPIGTIFAYTTTAHHSCHEQYLLLKEDLVKTYPLFIKYMYWFHEWTFYFVTLAISFSVELTAVILIIHSSNGTYKATALNKYHVTYNVIVSFIIFPVEYIRHVKILLKSFLNYLWPNPRWNHGYFKYWRCTDPTLFIVDVGKYTCRSAIQPQRNKPNQTKPKQNGLLGILCLQYCEYTTTIRCIM